MGSATARPGIRSGPSIPTTPNRDRPGMRGLYPGSATSAGRTWMVNSPPIRLSLRQAIGAIAILGIALAIGIAVVRPRRSAPPLEYRDAAAADRYDDVADVSIIQLIATPERFDGKPVRLTGWFIAEF